MFRQLGDVNDPSSALFQEELLGIPKNVGTPAEPDSFTDWLKDNQMLVVGTAAGLVVLAIAMRSR